MLGLGHDTARPRPESALEYSLPELGRRHDGPVAGSGVGSLDVANTVIAAAAFATAVASLVWQSVTWKLGGSRVSAELRVGALHRNAGIPAVLSYPARASWQRVVEEGRRNDFTRRALFLTVRNTGRQQVVVESSAVVFPGGLKLSQLNSQRGPSLPHTLNVGQPGVWAIELSEMQPGVEAARRTKVLKVLWYRRTVKVRLQVELGHGKTVRTRRRQRARLPRGS